MPHPKLTYSGGPRDGQDDVADDRLPVMIGDGSQGGVYHQTDAVDDGMRVYRWQPLTTAEAEAIVRGDLRANQR